MAEAVGRLDRGHARAVDHVELSVEQRAHHFAHGLGIVGVVAVHQHVNIGVDVAEHAAHDVAFSWEGFMADDGARAGRDFGRVVSRSVVVDVDLGAG